VILDIVFPIPNPRFADNISFFFWGLLVVGGIPESLWFDFDIFVCLLSERLNELGLVHGGHNKNR